MNNRWKWSLGSAIVVILLLVPLFTREFFIPNVGYRMMSFGWHMPMMYGGGMMGFGMMFIVGLILLSLFVLIGLAIAWLVKTLTATK